MSIARLVGAVLVLLSVLLAACSEPPRPTINLYRAIHAGDLDQLKRHLYWGTDITQVDRQGDRPLHVAARHGRVVIARELLKAGADPNARNKTGETPTQIALIEGKTQLAEVLLDAGAKDDQQELLFALVRAGVDDRDSLNFVVERGARVDAKDASGATPLHIAVSDGRLLLAKRLIDLGAPLDATDNEGRTPLAIAIEQDNQYIIELLTRFGARSDLPEASP